MCSNLIQDALIIAEILCGQILFTSQYNMSCIRMPNINLINTERKPKMRIETN